MTNNHLLSQAQSKVAKIFTMIRVQGMTHFVFKVQRVCIRNQLEKDWLNYIT